LRGAHFNEGAAFAGKATIFRLRRTVFLCDSEAPVRAFAQQLRHQREIHNGNPQPLKIILGIIAVLWIALFISWAAPSINMLGIRPRSIPGLIGIFTSPFLHGSMVHLAAK